jgi:hypothetical protein
MTRAAAAAVVTRTPSPPVCASCDGCPDVPEVAAPVLPAVADGDGVAVAVGDGGAVADGVGVAPPEPGAVTVTDTNFPHSVVPRNCGDGPSLTIAHGLIVVGPVGASLR